MKRMYGCMDEWVGESSVDERMEGRTVGQTQIHKKLEKEGEDKSSCEERQTKKRGTI
jgi:hypothetical protein